MPEQAKHTPEPWSIGQYEWIIETDDDTEIAQVDANNPSFEEDARRIVACVNACAGIPTEALEAGAIPALVAAARRMLTRAQAAYQIRQTITGISGGALSEEIAGAEKALACFPVSTPGDTHAQNP